MHFGAIGLGLILVSWVMPHIGVDLGWWSYDPQRDWPDAIRHFGAILAWFCLGIHWGRVFS